MIAWENYKAQMNNVKYLIARAKIEYENKKVKELRKVKKVDRNGIGI